MTREAARRVINEEGRRHTCVVYFTKRGGAERRIVCRYFGATTSYPHLIKVWDMEKGAERHVNLDTVEKIVVTGKTPGGGSFEATYDRDHHATTNRVKGGSDIPRRPAPASGMTMEQIRALF